MTRILPTSGAWPRLTPRGLALATRLLHRGITLEPVEGGIALHGPDISVTFTHAELDELRRIAVELELPIVGPAH